ncbi:MAG: type II toxin-antitoxin system ParD family antitoxin [Alteromonas sp.]|jgi:antitoxin ParD1/3/4|uniref:ribbon-helix-helix domain-containing protein n=2 Tax=Alteromonas sp. TaxID=232 RepID=UPI0032D91433
MAKKLPKLLPPINCMVYLNLILISSELKYGMVVFDSIISLQSFFHRRLTMAMVKKSITVTDQQEQWMQGQLATGNYASDSELLRDLLRKEQVRASQIEVIRQELIKAEQSGYSSRSPEDIVKAVITRKQTNGEL